MFAGMIGQIPADASGCSSFAKREGQFQKRNYSARAGNLIRGRFRTAVSRALSLSLLRDSFVNVVRFDRVIVRD